MISSSAIGLMLLVAVGVTGCLTNGARERKEAIIAYLSAECVKAGYAEGTIEHKGCMASKEEQNRRSGGFAVLPGTQPNKPIHCSTTSSGRSTICY